MTSFLLQFQEKARTSDRAGAKTATATRVRETSDQDYSGVLAAKTKTITEVRREAPDQDPKYSHHLVFPRSRSGAATPLADSAKTATATAARESKDQDRTHAQHSVLPHG